LAAFGSHRVGCRYVDSLTSLQRSCRCRFNITLFVGYLFAAFAVAYVGPRLVLLPAFTTVTAGYLRYACAGCRTLGSPHRPFPALRLLRVLVGPAVFFTLLFTVGSLTVLLSTATAASCRITLVAVWLHCGLPCRLVVRFIYVPWVLTCGYGCRPWLPSVGCHVVTRVVPALPFAATTAGYGPLLVPLLLPRAVPGSFLTMDSCLLRLLPLRILRFLTPRLYAGFRSTRLPRTNMPGLYGSAGWIAVTRLPAVRSRHCSTCVLPFCARFCAGLPGCCRTAPLTGLYRVLVAATLRVTVSAFTCRQTPALVPQCHPLQTVPAVLRFCCCCR